MSRSPQLSAPPSTDRQELIRWFRESRARSRKLFELVKPEAYYDRPISLRNPVVFYEGHLPAFSYNTLIRKGLRGPSLDENLEVLFARGIDPDDEAEANSRQASLWPSREETQAYGKLVDSRVEEALRTGDIEREGDPLRERANTAYTILEHEDMHHETMLYMWHMLPLEKKVAPTEATIPPPSPGPLAHRTVRVPAGRATLGASADAVFGWDNEYPEHIVEVPGFEIDVYSVTNADFQQFVAAGGYERRELWRDEDWRWREQTGLQHPNFWAEREGQWFWRGMFAEVALPQDWPVYVSHAEASAYARWKNRRLMTEAEFHRAAFGTPEGIERPFPWGNDPPDNSRGNFGFQHWEPLPVGSCPAGASAWGIHDLFGNGWEWTSSLFGPFEGFSAMASYPQYSADFFDNQHFVMKGGSPATSLSLLRRSFRNWFRPNYPYVYAKFRCVN
ncbi:MAG: SUMF1/EgtB/PvdO family nonheme iron enzyme [Acidobacteriota bacterium]